MTRWRNNHPAFIAELNRRRTELWDNGLELLRMLVPEAVAAIRNIINDPTNPNRWRVALEMVKMIHLPERFPTYYGPDTAEKVIKSRADNEKNRIPFLGDEATEEDILALVRKMEKGLP